jgi:hypothetical protein
MKIAVQVTASDGTVLAIQNGSVAMDSRRNITRTAELELIPTATRSITDVYKLVMTPDVELTIKRGLYLANGSIEYVSLGVFSTDEAKYSRSVSGVLKWSGSDRSKKISRSKFVDPYQITAGTSLATAGSTLLQSRFPDVSSNFANVLENVTATLTYDASDSSDPWGSARDLFADNGYDLNFDGNGVARAIQVPDPATVAPVFDYGAGATNLVLEADVSGTLEKTYNGVIVVGEGSSLTTPVRGEVWDTNPASPTYWLGGYGKVPFFWSSPLITSTVIAQAVATVLLSKLKGKTEQLTWSNVVNPALEPLDVISVTLGRRRVQAVIDQLTIPLRAQDSMTSIARQTTL